MKVLIVPSDRETCGTYRTFVYEKIKSDDIEFVISMVLTEKDITDPTIDAILIQRPIHPELPEFIKDCKKEGKLIVIETDDDISVIPANNPWFHQYKKGIKIHEECVRLADYVHVATPEFKKNDKSFVFYNALDLTKYGKRERTGEVHWHGSRSHRDSLELIRPTIRELLEQGIKVVLMSNLEWLKDIFKDIDNENLVFKGWVNIEDYYLEVKRADIFLTPLPKNKFNENKSELKCVESAAWGIPSVSSNIAPYKRFHELSGGGNILIKKERPKEWTKAIMEPLTNETLYNECSQKSLEAVKKYYNLEIVNQNRAAWWQRVLAGRTKERPKDKEK